MTGMDPSFDSLRDQVRAAAADGRPLCLRGGGSKDWYGETPRGEPLDTRTFRGIVAYEPTELVVTARCGTPLAELEAALAERHQRLAFEPPHFGAGATVGGCVAAGLSGPGRQAAGSVRDFVLGATLLDGSGEVLRFGGQVMKNVAGYDVSRLLAGSLGLFGVILEVSMKVLPQPLAEETIAFACDEAAAIERLNRWAGLPLPITASAWAEGTLRLRLAGAGSALRAARERLGGERVDYGPAFWTSLREQRHRFFDLHETPQARLWRLSVPSTTPPLGLADRSLLEWGGAQRWLVSELPAEAIRRRVSEAGGHATIFRGDKAGGVFQPLAAPVLAVHRRLKQAFDPRGLFNPGRMYPDL